MLPLVILFGLLLAESPTGKAPPKPPPPKETEAQARLVRKESRMKQRDREMDKRMKQSKN